MKVVVRVIAAVIGNEPHNGVIIDIDEPFQVEDDRFPTHILTQAKKYLARAGLILVDDFPHATHKWMVRDANLGHTHVHDGTHIIWKGRGGEKATMYLAVIDDRDENDPHQIYRVMSAAGVGVNEDAADDHEEFWGNGYDPTPGRIDFPGYTEN